LEAYRQAASKYDIFKSIEKLQKTVASLNALRLNQDALVFQLTQLLSPFNLQLLKENTPEETRVVIKQLLTCCMPLTYANAKKISGPLLAVAGGDGFAHNEVDQFLQESHKQSQWEGNKIWVAVVLAIVLCLLMFLLNR
jgi:hypothetical protein